ncbi:MAG TPA: PilC/PilY family type IV pilus protein [Vicinamibacterales bacterium]|nr:PilC/PilY family type IV pilus protein [Vicinamibacterales bacterium]
MTNTFQRFVCAAGLVAAVATPMVARAQLDPLLFLKTTQPNVILAIDTANRMQRDADNTYYDPGTYTETGAVHEATLGLASSGATTNYRRKYFDLSHLNPNENAGDKFRASRIVAVGDNAATYSTFYEPTRLAVARRGIIQAITANLANARFGLMQTRHGSIALPSAGNEHPVLVDDVAQQVNTDHGGSKWKVTRTTVTGSNSTQGSTGLITAADAAGANASIIAKLALNLPTAGTLLPGGSDARNTVDAPVGLLLDDARTHANTLITADAAAGGCRNTIVVLIVGGGEGTISPQDLSTKASTFLAVNGRRVPIYVVALFPAAAEVAGLQAIAANSGGQYFEITKAMVDAVAAGSAVPEVTRAVNTAVQHAFAPSTTFNIAPTTALPYGTPADFQVTSPIVGSVNLRYASKINASGVTEVLPDSETYIFNGSAEIPQRSNVLVTTGFELPGFEARLRAFRTYRPVADTSKPSGYRFTQDGSRLWVSSTPAAGSRNVYTVLPGSTNMVPFDSANVATIDDYLGVSDPSALIEYIRGLPMGAVLGSTPAFLDAPSLDPPPDADYPGFVEDNKGRRALIFVGANDGMLHALDARTGIEVWAFIPFNLLPKLRAMRYGQGIDVFNYFVDSSPKISDVKVAGVWRTYLFFGQGSGGTFYNTLDVTLEGMDASVTETSTDDSALLNYFSTSTRIGWKWSFPRLTSFDHTLAPYGELHATTASATEKTVGETWSDPAIGQVGDAAGPYVMVTGSGFLKYSTQNAYRSGATRSGTTFYVLNVANGDVLGTPRDVGADTNAETIDDCRVVNDCRRMKNALQMDPVATGAANSRFISKVYVGDLDGKVWRFALAKASSTNVTVSVPTQLYNAGADFPLFGSMAQVNVGTSPYIFLGTGSDLLPSNGVNQQYSLLVLLDNGASATKTAEILLERTDWPAAAGDEKVTAFPAVAGDIVFFTTTTYNSTTPCTPYTANLYAFTFIGGPAYDTNNDGRLSTGTTGSTGGKKGGTSGAAPPDSTKVFSTANVRATAPFIVDQHLVFSAGGKIQMFGDPNDFNNGVGQAGVRILSWRAVK